MKVSELVKMLQQMPQDVNVEIGLDSEGQVSEGIVVSLDERFQDFKSKKMEQYVFIGNY